MGARGPTTKREGRQRRVAPATVVELRPEGVASPVPARPAGVLAATGAEWDVFWTSDVARAVDVSDHPAVVRLFEYRDERRRSLSVLRRARLVDGSKGQPVMNPLAAYVATLEREIVALEDRLGLSPLARARLGITVGQAKMTAAELNRKTEDNSPVIDVELDELLEGFEEYRPPEEPA